jgi:hypothetical protein
MLRMLRIQPLTDEIRMVSAGSRLCCRALGMKYMSQAGTRPTSAPPPDGKKLSGPVNR